MDITTEFRSHWVAADGKHHAVRAGRDLQPIVNLDEMLAYADLGDKILPSEGMTSQFYARKLVEAPRSLDQRQITLLVEELTDWIPLYHAQWRAPMIELRNRWPGFDGQPVVAQ